MDGSKKIKLKTTKYPATVAKLAQISIFPVGIAAALIMVGRKGSIGFPKVADPAMHFVFAQLPIIIAGFILAVLVMSYITNIGRYVAVNQIFFTHSRLGKKVEIAFKNMTYTPPRKKGFRTAIVSDGRHFVYIEQFFFKDFEDIQEEIIKYRRRPGEMTI